MPSQAVPAEAVKEASSLLEREERSLRERLFGLADALARSRLARAPKRAPAGIVVEQPAVQEQPAGVELDAPFDTAWSQQDPRFSGLVHVFHLEWHGIRAAAGYSPGSKAGFTANRPLSVYEVQQIVGHCLRPGNRAVLFHGFSDNMEDVIRSVRRAAGRSLRLSLAWHGSTAQFHAAAEINGISTALRLRKTGVVDALVCVKPEMELLSPLIHGETLINLPPRLGPGSRRASGTGIAFIPVPDDWWKNPQTNVLAAARTPGVKRVYTCAKFERTEAFGPGAPVDVLGRLRRDELFRVLERVDAVLNVTLAECQPMTALEALSHGVPCLTGALSLGNLDAHPYQQLMQVAGTGSLKTISDRLRKVLELRAAGDAELAGIIADYERVVKHEAFERLGALTLS